MASLSRKQYAKRRLDQLITEFAPADRSTRQAYWRLIHAVRAGSQLLIPLPARGWNDPRTAQSIVRACALLAQHQEFWVREPELWSTESPSLCLQFCALVSHLLDKFPVPRFMAPVWMCEADKPWELQMYLHLAAGRSIRKFQLPVPCRLTKAAAAFFMQGPDDLHPVSALVWAQLRALGATPHLARLLVTRSFHVAPTGERQEFWESVFRFLIKFSPISDDEVIAIVNFINNQKFRPAEDVFGRGAGRQPVQPNFSMQGRTLMSLRRHMVNWKSDLQWDPARFRGAGRWKPSPIGPFKLQRDGVLWTIEELLSDRELRVEGGIMQHCVATYIHWAARRYTSIWSVQVHDGVRHKRMATVEVSPTSRRIWQAQGKRNRRPCEQTLAAILAWADQEKLDLHGVS